MSPASTGLLRYLQRYLSAHPAKNIPLADLHVKMTGATLDRKHLWRHTSLISEPRMGTALVYIAFLCEVGELTPAKNPSHVFHYKNPSWLKK